MKWHAPALAAVIASWWWASSVFSPLAASMAPRMWLYDTLFYLRFVLLAWAMVAVGVALGRRRTRDLSWFALPLCVAGLAWIYETTESGLRFKVRASASALSRSATWPYDTPRHRAGHFIIDTVRMPVDGQPWLWIGRPFGGGTGTGRALVRSGEVAPTPPDANPYRTRPLADGWWMAEMP